MPYLDDVYKELAAVESFINRSERARGRARSIPRERAHMAGRTAAKYPFMTPAVIMSMVRGGFPDSPEALHKLGELSTMQWLLDHPYGNAGGMTLTPAMRRARRPGVRRLAEEQQGQGSVPVEPEDINTEVGQSFYQNLTRRVRQGGEFTFVTKDGQGKLARPVQPDDRDRHPHWIVTDNVRGLEYTAQPLTGTPEREEGGGGGILSDISKLTGNEPSNIMEAQTAGLSEVGLNTAVRTGFQALDLPVQEFQGQVRNLYGAAHGRDVDWTQPQSDFLIQATTGMESGEGLFTDPESEVAQERRAREAERGTIGGHSVTLGRWAADALPFAPDSKPFQLMSGLVDLGVQIADPSAFVLGKLGKARSASKLFLAADAEEGIGLIRSPIRNVLKPQNVQKWLNSKEGAMRVDWLARTNDPYRTWLGLNRKVNFDTATEFADARSEGEVRDLLQKHLGSSIREVDTVSMPHLGLRDPAEVARRITDMPARGPIDAYDKDIVGAELEKWLFNAGADTEVISRHVSAAARAENPIQLNATIRDALRSADGQLAKEGISKELRARLVALHDDAHEAGSQTWIDTVSRQGQSDNVISLGDEEDAWDVGAFLYVEHAPRTLSLPDGRNIRRVRSKYSTILAKGDTGELRLPFATVDFLQNEIWKPIQLVSRVAWPVRVIGEEQIRMAAAGYDSMFRHPMSFIGWRVGKKGDIDIDGNLIKEADQHTNAMAVSHGGWVERSIPMGRKTLFRKTDVLKIGDYKRAWASEIARLANDPVSKYVANAEDLDDAKRWFSQGGGQGFKGDLARAHPGKFDTVDQADSYIEAVARRQRQAHGGNEELIDAIKTGKFGDADLLDGTKLDTTFVQRLDSFYDEFAPAVVVGDETHMVKGSRQQVISAMDRATDFMFGHLMTRRTNNLSRSPIFKQTYWREAERLLGFGNADARRAILDQAKNANLGSRTIRRMERAAKSKKVGELNPDEVDLLAKGHALDQTKELLYDLTKKGRGMDAMRLVFPFGEAWREVITRWFGVKHGPGFLGEETGLVWKNPKTIRRFQQLVQGARGEELGDFLGSPDGEGFFWTNQFGEEVFAYPGTQLLTDKLLGVPIPLTGRVQGLSMFGTVIPGLGPVSQVPVGWFLRNKPGPQRLKEMLTGLMGADLGPLGTAEEQILPFGSVGAEDQAALFSGWTYTPPYIKSLFQALSQGDQNVKQWNTSVMEIAGYLASSGEYDYSVGDRSKLMEDAANKAPWYFLIKGLAGAVAPASPDREWLVESNNGALLRATALAEELRGLEQKDYNSAGRIFLDKYGEDLYGIIKTSMTTSANYATPATKEGVAWVMANPGVEDDLPTTYGFFAPEGGDLDLALYNQDFRQGEKIRLNPPTWGRLMNDTRADLLYHEQVELLGKDATTDEGEAHLREYRKWLHEEYPGWQDESGELNKPDAQTMIRELYRALDNESAMKTDAGRGLRLYLEARDEIVAYAEQENNGVWPSSAEKMEDARAYLREYADWVMGKHPGFKKLFDVVLAREVEEEPE